MEDQELQEMLQLMNSQSLKITEQQESIQKLTEDLQQRESQLSEALSLAEQMKNRTADTSGLQEENRRLKERLNECDLRMELRLQDAEKEYRKREMELLAGRSETKEEAKKNPEVTTTPDRVDPRYYIAIGLWIMAIFTVGFVIGMWSMIG